MSTNLPTTHFDVIVVGAGPTGAALAGDLGQRGRSVLLVEQGDGVVRDARLHAVSIRTMELARRWGIDEALRNCGWPLDHPQDVVWGTSLSEPELARIHWPSIAEMQPPSTSPTFAQRCPQMWFNEILLSFAKDQPTVTTLLYTAVTDVQQTSEAVTAVLADGSGTSEVTADYLVACDGARSNIRRSLNIDTVKSSVWGTSAEAIIRSPQLAAIPLAQTLGRFTVVEPAGMSISLLPFDGLDKYRVTVMVGEGEITKADMSAAARKIAGTEVEIEFVTDILPWSNRETVATRFREGRVFLAGDAAHTMPTTGGLGMNTGIQDSSDLGWKLDAVLQGWAGEALLDSYDPERRECVAQTSGLASSIYKDWIATRTGHKQFWTRIQAGGPDGERARRELADSLLTTFRREFNNIPASLGYRYEGSPVCIEDGTPSPALNYEVYIPTARPGHRAPHVWLEPDVSTLDCFGHGFTLVVIGHEEDTVDGFVTAAQERSMPLEVLVAHSATVDVQLRGAYEAAFVLVRPDGHVAWRSDVLPDQPGLILDVVRGAVTADARTPDPHPRHFLNL
ncbi:FAD-dependent monooxygenase [Nocardia sp. NPDC057663]|uniref:FAD-dependent monooxygenase n=1 Tax=Nocardia sp. NPDC057663 TaxID=3346201 RepID=UPI0036714552